MQRSADASEGKNVLVLSHCIPTNRVFADYCEGIKAHSREYHYVDYVRQYLADGKDAFEKRLRTLVRERRIDCIFLIWWSSDLTFDFSFVAELSAMATVVINYFDTEFFFESVDRYYAQRADLVLLPDALSRYKFEQLGINALTTLAMYDGRFYAAREGAEKKIDVSFVGNLKLANRKEYLDHLKQNGISVRSYGIGSDDGFVSPEEMVEIFNTSRINLNFTAIADVRNYVLQPPLINQRIRQSKGRLAEVALCGGFLLTEYAPGIEQLFAVGLEMDCFKTKEELLAKVRHYLPQESERGRIASAGHRRAVENYDAAAGFGKVFAKLEELGRSASKTSYLDDGFIDNYVAFRFFYVVLFLLAGRFRHVGGELRQAIRHRRLPLRKSFHFAVKGFVHYMREHPRFEARLKSVKDRLKLQLKY